MSSNLNENSDNTITIALDAMGGDNAPTAVLAGADKFLLSNPNVKFLMYGDETKIEPMLNFYPKLADSCTLIHTSKTISPDEKPSIALRQGKDSSMGMAINSVKEGKAAALVSSGNTGALMAISKLALRTLPQIDRPAIAGIMPSLRKNVVMLDLGANAECNAENLFQFAIMGDAFAKVVLGIEKPRIGLLNIGSEEIKGNDTVKAAATMLRNAGILLNFAGFIEGNDIIEGTVDVVVTDGFSGNIALKTAEGTAKLCKHYMREAFQSSFLAKLGFLLAKPSLKQMSNKLDHRSYNGAMFLGLNGIVVKSHGSADEIGFCNAISVAYELAIGSINDKISKEILLSHEQEAA